MTCLFELYYWPGPERGKEAVIRKTDFAENHAEEEMVCSEFQDVPLGYLQ